MSELIPRAIDDQSVDKEFQGIIKASYEGRPKINSQLSLGKVAVEKIEPFGLALMTPFTDVHLRRAQSQPDMITVTTYSHPGGNICDR